MARSSGYSLRCNGAGSTADYSIELTTNALSGSYTKLSYVVWHLANNTLTNNKGIFGYWPGSGNGNLLFRLNGTTAQFYVYTGGAQYGPAAVSGGIASGVWQFRGFRFNGDLASGNRLAVFNPSGVKGSDAAGPTSMAAMSVAPHIGYGGSSSMAGFDGYMRNAFLWVDKALPDSAYAAMANGVHPLVFGPTHWWPLDNTLIDLVGGNSLTNAGAQVTLSTVAYMRETALPSGIIVPHRTAAAGGVSGTLAFTLDDITAAMTGVVEVTGTLSTTLDSITVAASGTFTSSSVTGTMAVTLDSIAVAASGTVTSPGVTGTLAATLEDVQAAMTGAVEVTGSLSATLDSIAVAFAGSVTNAVTGTFDITLDGIGFTATGTIGGWVIQAKDDTIWTDQTKSTDIWTLQ